MSALLAEASIVRVPDDELTWAGECPWTGNYCFGTENGNVLIYKDDGDGPFADRCEKLVDEAINGIAFHENLIGVRTRGEVKLYRAVPGGGPLESIAPVREGAHGISATANGLFVAPMGKAGLFCMAARSNAPPRAWHVYADKASFNYYLLSYLYSFVSKDVLASAARTDGLLTILVGQDSSSDRIVRLTSRGADFIDVCSIGNPDWPFAVAALCLDRSLVFIRNVLSQEQPQTLRFDELLGTPYSILSADGHLIVLTSRQIVILPDLATRYLNGEKLDCPIPYRTRRVRAVDAFVAYGAKLMILTDEGAEIIEIPKLAGRPHELNGVEGPPPPQTWDGAIAVPAQVTAAWDYVVA